MIPEIDHESADAAPILGNIAKFASEGRFSSSTLKFYLQSISRELLPDERVATCLRWIVPGRNTVKIMHSPRVQRAHYKNLVVCARLWICPVCASRITEVRREELTELTRQHEKTRFLLVTYTLRHSQDDSLVEMLDALMESFRDLKSGREWQDITTRYGWLGSVRSLEVTHGQAGWHPHLHELVFLGGKLNSGNRDHLQNELKNRWKRVLERHGRSAGWEWGVDIKVAFGDVESYVAKYGHQPVVVRWSLEHELTKAIVKRGRVGGRTPMQLLVDYDEGDKAAGQLFLEYATAFKGRKQLVWSKGLRKMLNLERELTDQEIAQDVQEDSIVLAQLTRRQWQIILGNDARAELLDVAQWGDVAQIEEFLLSLGVGISQGVGESE